ncbi:MULTISPECIES: wax ester/triacylglycerol synthase domain-containing protein [unclassified Mycobacterium]|uniref:wax ester/triacylglycerol synthase domain-containing protein n=1 Tax=unclassified Mycobacterium TaxID=2642494 RepID=UPI0029C8902E|nr:MULTISPECIES: wax ester/triacylglycerol synthase domain-containing protein [unclassified Mycobacterium]
MVTVMPLRDGSRMAPVDAMWFWMSTKLPNDQFQVYAFDGVADGGAATAELLGRARRCPDLCLRARDGLLRVGFPYWVETEVGADAVVVHALEEPGWDQCLAAVGTLMDEQLDVRRATWRVHLFLGVTGVPGSTRPATVAVLQISHTLADGIRSSALAAYLFGRDGTPIRPVPRPREPVLPAMLTAHRMHRELDRDVAAGVVCAPKALVRPLSTNDQPAGRRLLRTVLTRRSELPQTVTVTVGALAAISEALAGHLADRGEDVSELAAATPVAKAGERCANNFFDYVAVGLYPSAAAGERLALIDAELNGRRRARLHPAFAATERLFDAVPAPLRRLGVSLLDTHRRPDSVMGHTMVSSVNRGRADLVLAGCPVLFTSGYPAHLPICGLTHGVHGIGDTVAISVHAAESAVPDVDAYVDRLEFALRRLAQARDAAEAQIRVQ